MVAGYRIKPPKGSQPRLVEPTPIRRKKSCFPLFLPSSFQQEAFGCDCFFHVLSCFCAGWVVVAATFLFEGFRTSHIPLE